MYQSEQERLETRAARISDWLEWMNDLYSNLISRPAETASQSGFDEHPATKPCEHRRAWMRANLCLACDNTGWRPLTVQERAEGAGIDPYAANLSRGVTIVKDESPASRKSREGERLDHIIASLQHLERVRAGESTLEERDARTFRFVGSKHHQLNKILAQIHRLRDGVPDIYAYMPRETLCFALAKLVPGRIHPAPEMSR